MSVAPQVPSAVTPGQTLGWRLGETVHRSPLRRRARAVGIGDASGLLALAVARGCRHYSGLVPENPLGDPGTVAISDEELVALLLLNANAFEPVLIRAAAELLRRRPIDVQKLARAARRERCERALAYIAQAGQVHDRTGAAWWAALLAALGPQRAIAPGVLPHWSRFAALHGFNRKGKSLGARWIGAAARTIRRSSSPPLIGIWCARRG